MKSPQITPEHIDDLYTFTRKHFVEHYDLQTELVDHLAQAIEELWKEQPHLDFKQALQIEFKKFGVFGFMEVVEQRQSALSIKYYKLIWQHFKDYFKLPRVLLTILVIVITFYFMRSISAYPVVYALILGVLFLSAIVPVSIQARKRRKAQKKGRKRWMYEEILSSAGAGTSLVMFPFHIFQILFTNINTLQTSPSWLIALVSVFMVCYSISIYIMLVLIPQKAHVYLKETYPEYELVEQYAV